MRGDQTPTRQHETQRLRLQKQGEEGGEVEVILGPAIYRTKNTLGLFDNFKVVDTSAHPSQAVECGAYRHFGIMVFIDSTGSPTTLQLKVEFLDRWSGRWYQLKQGPFAALFWEDTDTASGITECFQGKCLGRHMRITLVGVGTSSSAYFTVSIAAEFWN